MVQTSRGPSKQQLSFFVYNRLETGLCNVINIMLYRPICVSAHSSMQWQLSCNVAGDDVKE